MPQNVMSALNQLQDEVAKVEQALLELKQKKQEVLQHQLSTGIESLSIQAHKVNDLANCLESEILNFKETAVEINNLYHNLQTSSNSQTVTNILDIKNLDFSIPTVITNQSQFILTAKTVNVHQQMNMKKLGLIDEISSSQKSAT
ncbi:hypothetical protein [Nostoc sp. FACHB-110]|uniref:hypothetical protein n=1 Tax=Nostoc sp. FACHB-110 TaxID=2692834 RepID=UPI001681E848|nr:hypothetical protein [Nostoc sp. FACHB-110]MBD2439006.1 hypothetical protein [Nostoc sp. FACHB-110]